MLCERVHAPARRGGPPRRVAWVSRRWQSWIFYGALATLFAVFAVAAVSERYNLAPKPARADELALATVDVTQKGGQIPRSFLGISIEFPDVPAFTGGAGADANGAFTGLLSNLRSKGAGPPVLRVGGGSTDYSWWNPAGRPKPFGVIYDVTPTWLAGLRTAARAQGSAVILGLNLAQRDTAVGANLARAALSRLGPDTKVSFELGNEPDYFTRRPLGTDRSGKKVLTRPRGYSFDDYLGDFVAEAKQLASQAPLPTLAGPGFCCTPGAGWSSRTPQFLDREASRISLVTNHGYPLLACQKDRKVFNYPTVDALLSEKSSHGFAQAFVPLVRSARDHHLPYRLTEVNSAACSGRAGVSDVFASALWATDVTFELAAAGVAGVNFHSAQRPSHYTPFWFEFKGGRLRANVRPEYYGLLLFARAIAGSQPRLLPVRTNAGSGLKLWPVIDRGGTIRVVALNKDRKAGRIVDVRLAGRIAPATLERLLAPSVDAREDITLGGRDVPPGSDDGRLRGSPEVERVIGRGGRYRFRVGPGSAALLVVPGPKGA